jgi:hypothetical protein
MHRYLFTVPGIDWPVASFGVMLFLAWAALMHGGFDTFLSIDGLQLAALPRRLRLSAAIRRPDKLVAHQV